MSETNGSRAYAPFTEVDQAIDWINSLIPFGIRPGLERIELMMERLQHPERRLKFIHVAGTNGKGSTCAILTSALMAAGYDVGTFTSPYIEKFTNRFKYNNEDISDSALVELANQIRPIVEDIAQTSLGSPTMFEVSTAIAILFYATVCYPDVVVLETGLGGRLDVTNIVTPIVSVITNIGHDHMDILGDTIDKIAFEKAGIIKPGVPVVTTVEQPEALDVIRAKATERQATLYALNEKFSFERTHAIENEQVFAFHGPFRDVEKVVITLNGAHQLKNASLALMTLEVLRQYMAFVIDDEQLLQGFRQAAWPGRLEMLREQPRLLVDGAHNPEGAETLAQALRDTYRFERCHIMMGMLSTKHHRDVLRHILPLADTLLITEPDFRKKMDAEDLAQLAEEVLGSGSKRPHIIIEPDWRQALAQLQGMTAPGDLAVVTGTLYLISDVRSHVLYQTDSQKGW
ncbi:bifunctional folylpolyglutamate synthase/dihydrofolate synthase [Paenibacillus sp. ACRRX]|uniref:bifunctional folylpolyglutamate synthase/dihydrofolate synthase n=1 Tax=Paenibacillus sp. ACRRX TaxID=2918206 RepID=UPI001EF42A3E|nr:folylpolyglutamate synthase/dihydrofolate synthase family protein [Paenibacillus sp. ACRRX]MCG7410198.1 bifunctional folylpolyglutamate synthase/dihydrofolate synthase [Paenibacillus sp. ACRRX]